MKRFIKIAFCIAAIVMAASCKINTSIELNCDEASIPEVLMPETEYFLPYTIVSGTGDATLRIPSSSGLTVYDIVDPENPLAGKVKFVTGTAVDDDTFFKIVVSNGYEEAEKVFHFEGEKLQNKGYQEFDVVAEASDVTIDIATNLDYAVQIPKEAQAWIKEKTLTKAEMVDKAVVLEIAANDGFERSATVKVTTLSGSISYSYTINQAGGNKDFKFTSTLKEVMTPTLSGTTGLAARFFPDASKADYVSLSSGNAYSHTFAAEGSHTMMLSTVHANSFTFDKLTGITEIDLSAF